MEPSSTALRLWGSSAGVLLRIGMLCGMGALCLAAAAAWHVGVPSGSAMSLPTPNVGWIAAGLAVAAVAGGWRMINLGFEARALRRSAALARARAETAERRLREAEDRAQAAERARSEFLAAMSHELRTPLNAIIGFAEILNSEMLGPIGRREYLDYSGDIRASGYQLLRVINDILDLSRAQSGSIDLQMLPTDVEEVVIATISTLRDEADHRCVRLETDIQSGLGLLMADELRLKQMLGHLISNAIKFTPRGGRVTVAARVEAQTLALSVADTGVGMQQDQIEQALTPFVQGDGRREREFEGIGLGLPLTRSLVALHGGALTIDGRPGEGTIVTLTFPYAEDPDVVLAA